MTLEELEQPIAEHQRNFLAAGRALRDVRERKLYRAAGFRGFESWCQARFGFGREEAKAIIREAEELALACVPGPEIPLTQNGSRPDKAPCVGPGVAPLGWAHDYRRGVSLAPAALPTGRFTTAGRT